MDIVCLGELLVDMFPAELGLRLVQVSAFRPKPGGAPANVAVAAARLGAQSAFIGKVGDDAFGHHLAKVLHAESVDVRGICYDAQARTTMAFIAMPDENTSEFVFYRNPGADMLLRPDELAVDLLRSTRAFHFGSISLIDQPSRNATLEAAQIARQTGALVSFDVNYRPSLWPGPQVARERIMETMPLANLIKVNEVELCLLTGGDLSQVEGNLDVLSGELLAHGPGMCVVTLGSKGSFFRIADGSELVPAFPVKAVDATGCGDGFVAGLLCQLVRGPWRDQLTVRRMRQAMRYANAVGALTSLTQGVIPALPTAAQVDDFLDRHAA